MDRVKVVQVIDVFQCIKLIRTKRPQFVETAVSYDEKIFTDFKPLKKLLMLYNSTFRPPSLRLFFIRARKSLNPFKFYL